MMMKGFLSFMAILFTLNVNSQVLWQDIDISYLRKPVKHSVEDARYLQSDYEDIKSLVLNAQDANEARITLPLPDGTFTDFAFEQSLVVEEGLLEKYPSLITYKGYQIDDPNTTIRFDVLNSGFHAAITKNGKKIYIDPAIENNKDIYVSFLESDLLLEDELSQFICGLEDAEDHRAHPQESQTRANNIPLRKYRMAISCTGEFGRRYGDVESTLEYIVEGLNKMNEIFESELAMRFILIARNDELLFFDPSTDPFSNTANGGSMLSVNTSVINNIIGSNSYDLGHVYNTSCNVGGIASLGSMCNFNKGAGVTCHSSENIPYFVKVTAHEIGHQMTAQHTFNLCRGNNESTGSAYEPGSGTTIMSYAGLCGSQNVVNNSGDTYYHSASLDQIYNHTRVGIADNCAVKEDVDNIEPVAIPSSVFDKDLYIPTKTPFILEGRATDANAEDVLTYNWEQMNLGPASTFGQPIGSAPRFRSYAPDENTARIIPLVNYVLSGTGHNAEILPDEDLQLFFNFVVRDNHVGGGTAVWEQVDFRTLAFTEDEGRFGITNMNTTQNLTPGEKITLEWNVSNTRGELINTEYMDIYYIPEGKVTFDSEYLLAERVPNTGSFDLYIPPTMTAKGRFLIRARGNIYFDVNNGRIEVAEPTSPTLVTQAKPFVQQICAPDIANIALETSGFGDIEGEVYAEITSELPESVTYEIINNNSVVGENMEIKVDFENYRSSEWITFDVTSMIEDVDTFVTTFHLDVVNNDLSSIAAIYPEENQSSTPINAALLWNTSENAQSYIVELATSPSFGESIVYRASNLTEGSYTLPDLLENNKVYYWRVGGVNTCTDGTYSPVYSFSTEVVACESYTTMDGILPKFITSSSVSTNEIPIEIFDGGNISDVNIPKLRINHANNKDLTVTLQSPSGEEAVLFSKICNNQRNVSCGFDDESNTKVKCPLNANIKYQPLESFEIFKGKDKKGEWKLIIQDTKPGDGGDILEFNLEICGAVTFNSPYLVNNEKLTLPPGDTRVIRDGLLKVADDDNSDDQLIYTLTSIPQLGKLSLNESTLTVGSQFSQSDINSGQLSYGEVEVEGTDGFSFTVVDNEGGYLGITNYIIDINDEYPSATLEVVSNDLVISPNPARELFTISGEGLDRFSQYTIITIDGTTVSQSSFDGKDSKIDIATLPSGQYIISFKGDKHVAIKKLAIIK